MWYIEADHKYNLFIRNKIIIFDVSNAIRQYDYFVWFKG